MQKLHDFRWVLLSSYFFVAIGSTILYSFDPATSSEIYPPSLTRKLGGFYCAGCGTLRGLHQILHGNIKAAWALNPLIFIVLPYLIYWLIAISFQLWWHIKLPKIVWNQAKIISISLIIISYSIMRNINHEWFTWLIPH